MKNTITKADAEKKISNGEAWVVGQTTSGARWGDPDPYWIINVSRTLETLHLEVDLAPDLDQIRSTIEKATK